MSNLTTVTENKSTGTKPGTQLFKNNNSTSCTGSSSDNLTNSDNQSQIEYFSLGFPCDVPPAVAVLDLSMELVTPERATTYLETMGRNRFLNGKRVAKYSKDLLNGTFTICLDPICFDPDGHMINGQHRCEAIKRTGVSTWNLIIRNVDPSIVFDRGAGRTVGQSLYMRGLISKEYSKAAYFAVLKCYLNCKHFIGFDNTVTEDQLAMLLNANDEELAQAISISGLGGRKQVCKKAGVQAALFAAISCGVDLDTIERFVRVVGTRVTNGPSESSAVIFRNYLDQIGRTGARLASETAAIAENAIHDFVLGKPRTQKYKNLNHFYINKCAADIV